MTMIQSNNSAKYTGVAIALHWIIALLIISNFVLAQIAEDLPRELKGAYMGPHKAIGMTVLALSVARLLWRFTHRPPPLESSLKSWERALAHITHIAFYVLMIALPLSGWMMSSAGNYPISFFGLFDIPLLPIQGNKVLGGIGHEGHEVMAKIMYVLFFLHVAGALKHQFIDKKPSLSRMSPHG